MSVFRSLRSRNFRLFFIGQGLSLIGTWMSMVATNWMVFRLADARDPKSAPFVVGLIGFCSQLPIFLMAPFAGVLVDRWNPHRVLMATQTLSFIQSGVLAALTLTHAITIPQIAALAIFQGFVNAFDMPARQVFLLQVVEHTEDLSNAIALNSSVFNGARVLGPSIAGVLIARFSFPHDPEGYKFGAGLCFSVDAVSFLAVLIALLMMTVHHVQKSQAAHVLDEFKTGIAYAFHFTPIRAILLFAAALSITTMPIHTLLPFFAVELTSVQDGAQTFGFLTAASGTGAIVGGLYLAWRRSVVGLDRVMAAAAVILGAMLIAFGMSGHLWLSLLCILISGLAMVIAFASGNTLLQTIVEDDKRGRVMSLFGTALMGMACFGSYLAGALADRIGPPKALMVTGSLAIVVGLALAAMLPAIRKLIRPIYLKKGIVADKHVIRVT